MNLLDLQESRFAHEVLGMDLEQGRKIPWWWMRGHPHIGSGGFSDLWVYYPIPIALAVRAWIRVVRSIGIALYHGGFMDIEEGAVFDWSKLTPRFWRVWWWRVDTARAAGFKAGFRKGYQNGYAIGKCDTLDRLKREAG